jgi:hypothetical protein
MWIDLLLIVNILLYLLRGTRANLGPDLKLHVTLKSG